MFGRVAVLGIVAGVLGTLYLVGFFEIVQDVDAARDALRRIGVLAPLLYVAVFALIQPLFFPASGIMLTGAVLWSFEQLLIYSWLGAIAAACVAFGFARYVARDFVASRLPERIRSWGEGLEERGLRSVIVLRLIFFVSPPASWLLGLSRVRFGPFLLGTAIGILPGMAALSWIVSKIGGALVDWLGSQPRSVWASGCAVLIGLIVLRVFMSRRQRAARARRDVAGDSGEA